MGIGLACGSVWQKRSVPYLHISMGDTIVRSCATTFNYHEVTTAFLDGPNGERACRGPVIIVLYLGSPESLLCFVRPFKLLFGECTGVDMF